METTRRVACGRERWLAQVGEATLIGGWAEVALDAAFAESIDPLDYQVFVTAYDPAPLFVQNRTAQSFEIHALPGAVRVTSSMRCGYQVLALRARRSTGSGR